MLNRLLSSFRKSECCSCENSKDGRRESLSILDYSYENLISDLRQIKGQINEKIGNNIISICGINSDGILASSFLAQALSEHCNILTVNSKDLNSIQNYVDFIKKRKRAHHLLLDCICDKDTTFYFLEQFFYQLLGDEIFELEEPRRDLGIYYGALIDIDEEKTFQPDFWGRKVAKNTQYNFFWKKCVL